MAKKKSGNAVDVIIVKWKSAMESMGVAKGEVHIILRTDKAREVFSSGVLGFTTPSTMKTLYYRPGALRKSDLEELRKRMRSARLRFKTESL
jgi:hypothetical protein